MKLRPPLTLYLNYVIFQAKGQLVGVCIGGKKGLQISTANRFCIAGVPYCFSCSNYWIMHLQQPCCVAVLQKETSNTFLLGKKKSASVLCPTQCNLYHYASQTSPGTTVKDLNGSKCHTRQRKKTFWRSICLQQSKDYRAGIKSNHSCLCFDQLKTNTRVS